ncbi:hypothetical protein JHK87_022320 [Glycine soja]|nr:hypothetical protein JHK87_022320 [Glycine soja]
MKEYKVDLSWTESIVIPNNGFSPICITKDGGIIGSNITGSGRLEKLNDKGELLEHFIYGGGEWLYSLNLQSAMYRESLLSPSSVIRETPYDPWKTRECDRLETSEDDQW